MNYIIRWMFKFNILTLEWVVKYVNFQNNLKLKRM